MSADQPRTSLYTKKKSLPCYMKANYVYAHIAQTLAPKKVFMTELLLLLNLLYTECLQ